MKLIWFIVAMILFMVVPVSGTVVGIGDYTFESSKLVPVVIEDADKVGCGEIRITYDTSVVQVNGVREGEIGVTHSSIDNGQVYVNTFNSQGEGVSGNVTFASLMLEAVDSGKSEMRIEVITLSDTNFSDIDYVVRNGMVVVPSDESSDSQLASGGGGGGGGGGAMPIKTQNSITATPSVSIPVPDSKETENGTNTSIDNNTAVPSAISENNSEESSLNLLSKVSLDYWIIAVVLFVFVSFLLVRRGEN